MQLMQKIYCRCFQGVLRLALPVLPYRTPRVLSSLDEIPGLLKSQRKTHPLIVTDGFVHISGMAEPLKKALNGAGLPYTVYDEVTPNPTILNVELARERYLAEGCDCLIALGGGSAMDCAKAVGARVARPRKPIPKMRGILKILKPIPYLIAIPTTAGTGSETTLATVITDQNSAHKFPINDFVLIPRAAVLDPEMTRSLPPHMTAATGMDALTHAVEAYIGRSTTRQTRADALEALRLIHGNLEKAYRDGSDMTARANMLKAAFLAGGAFSKSYVGYCHAVAHSLGGKYHTPHGLANAVLLPYVLTAYGSAIEKKAVPLCAALGLGQVSESEAPQMLIREIRRMNAALGLPETLPGIQKEDIPQLAAYAHREANPLYPVPKLMDRRELEGFYYDVMEECL